MPAASKDLVRFFPTPAAFRKWLHANHGKVDEQWVGFYRKDSGKPSITWPESVDEALCVGWIDGIRKSIDGDAYKIRFTPRKASSTWSAVNQKKMAFLISEKRVLPAGLAAWERRTAEKSGTYSYENRHKAVLDAELDRAFRSAKKAWKYFSEQPPGYRKTCVWWIISAKQADTRTRRLEKLIGHSAAGEWLPALRPIRKGDK